MPQEIPSRNSNSGKISDKARIAQVLIFCVIALIVSSVFSSPMALSAGVAISLTLGNPWLHRTKLLTPKVMSYSLVALGAGMNLQEVARVGLHGFSFTLLTIGLTLFLGFSLCRLLKSEVETSTLITVGTAICGGSAIAAMAPTIRAKSSSVSMALAIVFLLNSVALFIFPPLGHSLGFDQNQFGLWAALAIHDTSSVVGATMAYGQKALEVGTTVKLARALWIVPMTFFVGSLYRRFQPASQETQVAAKKPWFILGFLLSAAFFTFGTQFFPEIKVVQKVVETIGRRGLIISLFLIGLNINVASLKSVGPKPVAMGVLLWMLMIIISAGLILSGAIS